MEIDCESVKAKLDANEDFLFLDCREQAEFDAVSIDGSTLIPMSEIQERIAELEAHKDREIIVFCHHGGRSLQVAMWLSQQNYKSVRSMHGGIDVWAQTIDASLPRY